MNLPVAAATSAYVFYPSLKERISESGYENLLSKVAGKATLSSEDAAGFVLGLAQAEFSKEQALLMQHFGNTGNYQLTDLNSGLELTKDINYALNVAPIFRRVLTLLYKKGDNGTFTKESKGRTEISQSFADGYLKKELDKLIQEKEIEFINGILTPTDSTKSIEGIFKEAIERAFNNSYTANVRKEKKGYEKNELDMAYEVLLNHKNSILKGRSGNGGLIDTLYKTYNIEQIIKDAELNYENLKTNQGSDALKDATKKSLKSSATVTKRGSLHEISMALIMEELKKVNSQKGIKINVVQETGGKGMKPDLIFTLDMSQKNADVIAGALEQTDPKFHYKREKHIDVFDKISGYLSKIDKGFLVLENAKNYRFNLDSFNGYDAGSPITAENFIGMNEQIGQGGEATTLIRALINTMDGAIYSNDEEVRNNVTSTISTLVAEFLFDDFKEIGAEYSMGKGNAIHLLNLGNIKVPLSVFLWLFGNAIQNAESLASSNPTSFVKVKTELPSSIKFKGIEESDSWNLYDRATISSYWEEQKEEALKNTTIQMFFFQEVESFMRELAKITLQF